jgi:hypothetical protein
VGQRERALPSERSATISCLLNDRVVRRDSLSAQSKARDASSPMLVVERKQGPRVMSSRVCRCRIPQGAEA